MSNTLTEGLLDLLSLHERGVDGKCLECDPKWIDSKVGCDTRVKVESLLKESVES